MVSSQNMHKQDKLTNLYTYLKTSYILLCTSCRQFPLVALALWTAATDCFLEFFCHGTAKLVEKGAATLQGSKLRIESVFNIQLANKSLGKRESRKRL